MPAVLAGLQHADRASNPIELRGTQLTAIDHRRWHACIVLVFADRGADRRKDAVPDTLFGNEPSVMLFNHVAAGINAEIDEIGVADVGAVAGAEIDEVALTALCESGADEAQRQQPAEIGEDQGARWTRDTQALIRGQHPVAVQRLRMKYRDALR